MASTLLGGLSASTCSRHVVILSTSSHLASLGLLDRTGESEMKKTLYLFVYPAPLPLSGRAFVFFFFFLFSPSFWSRHCLRSHSRLAALVLSLLVALVSISLQLLCFGFRFSWPDAWHSFGFVSLVSGQLLSPRGFRHVHPHLTQPWGRQHYFHPLLTNICDVPNHARGSLPFNWGLNPASEKRM